MIIMHCPEISPGHAEPAVRSAVLPLQQQDAEPGTCDVALELQACELG
jgi:hypothetical protein